MKKKFTLLIAALTLLTMMVQPGKVMGQTKSEGDTHEFAQTFSQLLNNNASIPSITIAEQEYPVKKVTISYRYNKTITNAVTMEVLVGGTSWGTQYSTGTGQNYATVDFEGTATTGDITIIFTNNTGDGTGHGTFYVNNIILTEGATGGGSDPEIHFNSQSANIGTNNPVGTEVSTSFIVYQSNLTEDITFDIEGVGSLDPESIGQGANPTEVTWSYTPAAAGSFNTTITATSGTASATYSIYGEAKAIHNVNIAAMTNGNVTASPSSGIQGTNIDLTITPDAGYALETLTVVDGDNNELTVTNNRFQMPDSDVTVSATFEESSAVTVVDYLDREFTGIADGATSYSSWTGKTGASGAVYAGNSAGSNNSIQLRTNGSASGIVTTASAGKVTKVEVDWNSNTATGRKINVYGSNNAYTDASKLHNATTAGTLIGTIDFGSTELAITDEYAYIGIRSTSGALYLNWVKISWSSEEVPAPSFTITNNNELAYDATEGSFNFTVNNPVDGGVTTVSEDVDWISDVAISGNSVTFNTTANEGAQREGVITLTYTYNTTETVTKDVTVTQAAAPVVYSTIPELFAAATITETNVFVTFNDWVVSGVSTNGKNVFVTDNNSNGFVIFSNDDMSQTYPAGSILAGTAVSCTLKKYNGFAELLNVNADDLTITDGGTVTAAEVAMADLTGVNTGALLHYENLTCNIDNNKYYLTDGTTTLQVYNALYAFEALEDGNTYNITGVYQQYNNTKEILPRSADDIEEVVPTEPTITVQPATVSTPFTGAEGTLTVTYENITTIVAEVKFYEADGVTEATFDWIVADINSSNNVDYIIDANTGEARSAYLKVYALGNDSQDVYSNLVTINQAEYVAPTYAELPFEFDGGRADIEGTDGLYQEGLGSDYNNSPKLKFDGTGDWVLLQFTERPGTLTFDIKGNSFSGGTFTVQTSEDGATYTDLENYTNDNFGNTLHSEEFDNLDENVRYIKWIYTEKVNGNVALGNITLAEYTEPVASITVDPDEVNVDAEEHDGTLDLTYEHMTITSMDDFDIQFYDAEEAETDEPDWIEVLVAEQDPSIGDGYVVSYYMIENEGDARTAYFKVFATDDSEFVYSNLVTINQAAYVPTPTGVTYTLVTDASQIVSGKHYIIASGIDGDVKAMGGQQTNNRAVVDVTAVNNSIVAVDLYEFVINGPQTIEEESYFTIYDTNVESTGYLYAAGAGGSGSNNHLKTRATNANDDKGIWTIAINNNKATIKAKAINRNTIRYNANSKCFSCYASGQADVYLFVKDNDTDYEYYGCEITYSGDNIPADETITIGAGSVMGVTNTFTNTDPTNLIIEEGGQLIHNQPVAATIQKNITGYNTSRDAGNSAYQLIASPVADPLIVATETNLTTSGEFDLYIFDENQPKKEWRNYKKTGEFTTIENGKGYLYANANNATISFAGTFKPSASDVTVNLAYTDGNRFAGWNLVGNPFACNAYANDTTGKELAFYKMNSAGDGFVAVTNGAIAPMEGIFVKASATGQSFIFSRQEAPVSSQGNGNLNIQVAQAVTNRDAQPSFDNAIIRFDGGNDLEKFSFSDDNDKLYIPQNGKDYAVVRSEARGEMPVNFKAAKNGTYTISFSMDDVEFNYLHLIDNKTGMDIDLLQTSSYTFEANTIDYASRFKLVFSTNSDSNSTVDNDFGFISDGNLMILGIEGTATLQVIDITGRMISNETFSGSYNKAINTKAGVYMLRLIQGNDVRTQKIVVR